MALSASMEEPSREGLRLGRYTLRQRIARGGMGAIYLATIEGAAGFERWLAIKLMHGHLSESPNLVKRFHDEARVASRIQHPNVCAVLDFGEAPDGVLYLVMEYLHGEPLTELSRADTPIPPWLALRTVADAARGLDAAHELRDEEGEPLGLVHRDVSPQNLFVLYDGPTKILDFGVVRVRDQIATTTEGSLRGKLGYMSPEQLEAGPLDRRADVFSLGVVLWELLVGRRLYKRDTAGNTVKAILFDTPPPPSRGRPGLDPRIDALVGRALRHEPELRFPTAAALADAIEELLAALGERSDHARVAAEMTARFGTRREQKEAVLAADERTEAATVIMPDLEPSHVRPAARRPWALAAVAAGFLALGIGGTVLAIQLGAEPAPPIADAPIADAPSPTAPQPTAVAPTTTAAETTAEPEAGEPETREPETREPETREPEVSRRSSARPAARAEPAAPGRINVIALPEAEVYLGGRRLGRTPLVGAALPSGRQRLELRAADGRREHVTVRVRAGETTAVSHRFGER